MLIYHPAFDAYHCVFRMLRITEELKKMETTKLRMLDYYFCFPAEVALIQLPRKDNGIKKIAQGAKNQYHGPVSSARTFRDMEPIQHAAVRMFAASGVFDSNQLELGTISRTEVKLPVDILNAQALDSVDANPLVAISNYILYNLSQLPLSGPGGMKQRTGLMEYRYDVI